MRDDGVALLVDLDKARYAMGALDVAHVTLVTSTTWEVGGSAELNAAEVVPAYRLWALKLGAAAAGEARD